MPALPLHTAGPYVAAAYIVFFALGELTELVEDRRRARVEDDA